MESVILTTDRLELRAPTPADIDAITDACQDPEIARWTTVPSPYTRKHAEDFVAIVAAHWADESEFVWAVREDDVLIGMIGLHNVHAHAAGTDAEIGFWLVADARGRGLLSEASRAVIDWAFGERGMVRLGWRAVAGNVASARAARALGFHYEGFQRLSLTSPRGRDDGWFAGLLATDDRMPVDWPVLDDES